MRLSGGANDLDGGQGACGDQPRQLAGRRVERDGHDRSLSVPRAGCRVPGAVPGATCAVSHPRLSHPPQPVAPVACAAQPVAPGRSLLLLTLRLTPADCTSEGPPGPGARRAISRCSSVAQRQSIRLLTGGLLVRIQPEEPTSNRLVHRHLGLIRGWLIARCRMLLIGLGCNGVQRRRSEALHRVLQPDPRHVEVRYWSALNRRAPASLGRDEVASPPRGVGCPPHDGGRGNAAPRSRLLAASPPTPSWGPLCGRRRAHSRRTLGGEHR